MQIRVFAQSIEATSLGEVHAYGDGGEWKELMSQLGLQPHWTATIKSTCDADLDKYYVRARKIMEKSGAVLALPLDLHVGRDPENEANDKRIKSASHHCWRVGRRNGRAN